MAPVLASPQVLQLVLRQVPIREGEKVVGYVDVVSGRAYRYRRGAPSERIDAPEEMRAPEAEARGALLEVLADHDDSLLEKVLEDVAVEPSEIYRPLHDSEGSGAVIGVLLAGDASSLDQAVLGVVGGGTALLSHLVKAGGRLAINSSPEPASNILASLTEDVAVLGVVWFALENPQSAAAIAGVLLLLGLVMLFFVGRLVRRGWRRWKKKGPIHQTV